MTVSEVTRDALTFLCKVSYFIDSSFGFTQNRVLMLLSASFMTVNQDPRPIVQNAVERMYRC